MVNPDPQPAVESAVPRSAPSGSALAPSRWIWLPWLVFAVVCVLIATRVHTTADLRSVLPDDDPQLNRLMALQDAGSGSGVLALTAEAHDAADLARLRNAMIQVGGSLAGVGAKPFPPPDAADAARLLAVVRERLPVLFTADDLAETARRIAPDSLRARLAALKVQAANPDDMLSAALARDDILGLSRLPMAGLDALLGGGHVDGGVIIHADGRHLLMPLAVAFKPDDAARTHALMVAVAAAIPADCAITATGSYASYDDNQRAILHDLIATLPFGLAGILLVLLVLSRSPWAIAMMYLPAGLGFAAALAALAAIGAPVSNTLIGLGGILLGVAVDYGIQMVQALRDGEPARVRRPLLVSCTISVCAFAALVPSPVPALRSLALMVMVGLAVAWLSARTLLPTLVGPRRKPSPGAVARDRGLAADLVRWCGRRTGTCLALAILATVILAPGMVKLEVLSDLQRMDASTPATRAAKSDLLHLWGNLEPYTILVAEDRSLDPALARAAAARVQLGLNPSRLERWLPTAAEQARRRQAWDAFWTAHAGEFAKNLTAACAAVHLRPKAFANSIALYRPGDATSPPTVSLADWTATPVAIALAQLVKELPATPGGSSGNAGTNASAAPAWRVLSPVDLDAQGVAALRKTGADRALSGVWLATRSDIPLRAVTVMRGDLAQRSLVLAAIIIGVVSLLLRAWRPALAVLTPPAVALLWTFGLMGWIGVELTPFTVLVAAFVGGIGIDCAVFLAHGEDRERLAAPVIACIGTAVAGSAALIGARHPLLSGVGLTLTIGMLSCLGACLLLTPGIAGSRAKATAAP